MRDGMTPCYGCDERDAECHAKCERYIAWRNNRMSENNVIEGERDVRNYVVNSIYRNRDRKKISIYRNKYRNNTRRG